MVYLFGLDQVGSGVHRHAEAAQHTGRLLPEGLILTAGDKVIDELLGGHADREAAEAAWRIATSDIHDLAVVSQLADTVAVMFDGEILEYAPAAQLFARPEHPYTQRLIEAIPSAESRGARLSRGGERGAVWRLDDRVAALERALRIVRGEREPPLAELLRKLSRVDLVVIEGYKTEPHRKIEVYRAANDKPFLFPTDPDIVGVAADVAVETSLPTTHLDDIAAVAAMMRRFAMPIEDVLAMAET